MNARYKVLKGSESAHCCFEGTVVDNETPHPAYGPDRPYWLCECFDLKDAEKIAQTLNGAEDLKSAARDAVLWISGCSPGVNGGVVLSRLRAALKQFERT